MLIHETHHRRDGKIMRKICFAIEGRDFVVWEQFRKENLITHEITWENIFICQYPTRILARTSYMGLVTAAAYEEFGVEEQDHSEVSLSYAKAQLPV